MYKAKVGHGEFMDCCRSILAGMVTLVLLLAGCAGGNQDGATDNPGSSPAPGEDAGDNNMSALAHPSGGPTSTTVWENGTFAACDPTSCDGQRREIDLTPLLQGEAPARVHAEFSFSDFQGTNAGSPSLELETDGVIIYHEVWERSVTQQEGRIAVDLTLVANRGSAVLALERFTLISVADELDYSLKIAVKAYSDQTPGLVPVAVHMARPGDLYAEVLNGTSASLLGAFDSDDELMGTWHDFESGVAMNVTENLGTGEFVFYLADAAADLRLTGQQSDSSLRALPVRHDSGPFQEYTGEDEYQWTFDVAATPLLVNVQIQVSNPSSPGIAWHGSATLDGPAGPVLDESLTLSCSQPCVDVGPLATLSSGYFHSSVVAGSYEATYRPDEPQSVYLLHSAVAYER